MSYRQIFNETLFETCCKVILKNIETNKHDIPPRIFESLPVPENIKKLMIVYRVTKNIKRISNLINTKINHCIEIKEDYNNLLIQLKSKESLKKLLDEVLCNNCNNSEWFINNEVNNSEREKQLTVFTQLKEKTDNNLKQFINEFKNSYHNFFHTPFTQNIHINTYYHHDERVFDNLSYKITRIYKLQYSAMKTLLSSLYLYRDLSRKNRVELPRSGRNRP